MVFFNEKKFACQTCIKGHRSSGCKHTDRPLFEIKKKGRPVTQCDHCRELRKTKQVHVRCQCGSKEDTASPPASNKRIGEQPLPTFPHGISQESLSPSNQHRIPPSIVQTTNPCSCETGGECHCSTPRSSYKPKFKRNPTITRNIGSVVSGVPDDPSISRHQLPLGNAQISDLQSPYSQSGHDELGTYPSFDDSTSNHRPDLEIWNDNQLNDGAYPAPSQSQRDPGQYDPNANIYSEQASLQAPAPPVSPASNSPICNCGMICHCPGCADHPGPGRFPSAASECSIGCSTGLGCLNEPPHHHARTHAHVPSTFNPYQGASSPSHFYPPGHIGRLANNGSSGSIPVSLSTSSTTYPSTISFHTMSSATSFNTSAASHLDGSVNYSHAPTWSSGTSTPVVPEPSRRTSFAISGERDASSPSSLAPPHAFSASQAHNNREIPQPSPSPIYPSSQPQAFPVDNNQTSSSHLHFPFRSNRNSNTNGPETASTSTSKPSVVRRGFQRLLPRNPPELAPNPGRDAAFIHPMHHLPPTGHVSIPSSHSKALRGETAAALNRSTMMPYNSLM